MRFGQLINRFAPADRFTGVLYIQRSKILIDLFRLERFGILQGTPDFLNVLPEESNPDRNNCYQNNTNPDEPAFELANDISPRFA